MTNYQRDRVRAWLLDQRGAMSQADLADDITTATGWRITRDRYSKYESGAIDVGPTVLQHFVDYWTAKGRPSPDISESEPAPEVTGDALVAAAIDRHTQAIEAQTEMLRAVLEGLLARTVDPTVATAVEQWGLAQAANLSPLLESTASGSEQP